MTVPAGCGDAAPYVLGALDEAEARTFALHRETCAICRDEVASLKVAADALALAVEPRPAPAALGDRIMTVVRRDAGLLAARGDSHARRPRRFPGGGLVGSLAGVVAAVAIVLAVTAGNGGRSSPRLIAATVTGSAGHAVLADWGNHSELRVAHLRPAGPGRIYEVWVQRHGLPQPTNSLFDVTANGSASAAVPGSLKGVQAVMVTAEPRGGSSTPTSRPVVVASLS